MVDIQLIHEALEPLSGRSYKSVMTAVVNYISSGQIFELKGIEKSLFTLIKYMIDTTSTPRQEEPKKKRGAPTGNCNWQGVKSETIQELNQDNSGDNSETNRDNSELNQDNSGDNSETNRDNSELNQDNSGDNSETNRDNSELNQDSSSNSSREYLNLKLNLKDLNNIKFKFKGEEEKINWIKAKVKKMGFNTTSDGAKLILKVVSDSDWFEEPFDFLEYLACFIKEQYKNKSSKDYEKLFFSAFNKPQKWKVPYENYPEWREKQIAHDALREKERKKRNHPAICECGNILETGRCAVCNKRIEWDNTLDKYIFVQGSSGESLSKNFDDRLKMRIQEVPK